jgi:putative ATPase
LQPSASDVAQAVEAGLACGADFEAGKAPSDSSLLTSARDAWNEYRGQILNAVGGDIRLSWNVLENLAATRLSAAQGGLTDASAAAAAVFENLQRSFTSTKHYDYASAMIKSMRGSDPDAALYYAIAALDSGEDILFLLRRCLIFASEDVGNADPQALGVAANAHYSASQTGLPEARIPLAQAVTYLAATVKSNSSYVAIDEVRAWRQQAEQSVVCGNAADLEPPACIVIKGSPDYVYPHDMADAFHRMEYLQKAVAAIRRVTGAAYRPSERGVESRIAERLRRLWEKIGG